jgi:hypothetical protein
MLLYKSMRDFDHFELKKSIMKNLSFGIKMPVEQFLSIFAYICKNCEDDINHVFHHSKNLK